MSVLWNWGKMPPQSRVSLAVGVKQWLLPLFSFRACYGVLRFIMESGAKGCEVVVSGKLRGQRAKSMKFVDGLMIHSGDPVNYYVDTAVRHVLLRQGEWLACRSLCSSLGSFLWFRAKRSQLLLSRTCRLEVSLCHLWRGNSHDFDPATWFNCATTSCADSENLFSWAFATKVSLWSLHSTSGVELCVTWMGNGERGLQQGTELHIVIPVIHVSSGGDWMFPVENGASVFQGTSVLWPLRLVAKHLTDGTHTEFKSCWQLGFLGAGRQNVGATRPTKSKCQALFPRNCALASPPS